MVKGVLWHSRACSISVVLEISMLILAWYLQHVINRLETPTVKLLKLRRRGKTDGGVLIGDRLIKDLGVEIVRWFI